MNINYDFILNSKDEFNSNISNKTYYVLKVNNPEKEKNMIDKFNEFINNQNINLTEKHYIGIDFEFNKVSKTKREIALMQINLENNSNKGMIFILYPPMLDQKNNKILIKLLTHTKIIKIFHGAESLDIPYLFNELLITNENINNFSKNFYDTKHLCDYYYYTKDEPPTYNSIFSKSKIKCGIYDLLLHYKIITKEKMDELNKLSNKIGPLWLINIDINNLNNNLLKYSLYDVLYLPEVVKKTSLQNVVYAKIIPGMSSFINKWKRGYIKKLDELKKIINKYNNYYLLHDEKNGTNTKISFSEIWMVLFIMLSDEPIIEILFEINYFKAFIELVSKLICYMKMIVLDDVYISKDKKINNNKKLVDYYNFLKNNQEINKIVIMIDEMIDRSIIIIENENKIIKNKFI